MKYVSTKQLIWYKYNIMYLIYTVTSLQSLISMLQWPSGHASFVIIIITVTNTYNI